MAKKMIPDDQWNEGTIAQFDDGSVRITRGTLSDPDTLVRVGQMLGAKGPQAVEVSFTQMGRPVWMSPGDVLLANLVQLNGQTFRVEQHGRVHPVDYYWEEVEWMEFASPLPNVT